MFVYRANELFGVHDWHGYSNIHVSMCDDRIFKGMNSQKAFMDFHRQRIAKLWATWLPKEFQQFEWLLTPPNIIDLCMLDIHSQVVNGKPYKTGLDIVNPETKNEFYKVALLPGHNIAAGIRFWVDTFPNHVDIGTRFRITPFNCKEDSIREQAERVREGNYEAVEKVLEYLEIQEPGNKNKVTKRVRTHY